MEQEEYEQVIFKIIAHAGEAKALAYEALELAENDKYEKAYEKLSETNTEFLKAHHVQTDVITRESRGESITVTPLFVHAQDHLTSAQTEKNLIERMIKMYEKISKL
jgi:PTS system cellobiose-specific IIA component